MVVVCLLRTSIIRFVPNVSSFLTVPSKFELLQIKNILNVEDYLSSTFKIFIFNSNKANYIEIYGEGGSPVTTFDMPVGNNTYLLSLYNTHIEANIYWFGICQVWDQRIINLNEISQNYVDDKSITLSYDGLTISGMYVNHVRAIKIGYYRN